MSPQAPEVAQVENSTPVQEVEAVATPSTTATATKPAKKSGKKAAKAAAKKPAKAAKAAKPASSNGEGKFGIDRDHDLPWNDKKVAIFKAMKKMGAVGATAARSAVDIAERAQVTSRDVRHYCYHAKAAGLVGVHEMAEIRGYGFALTAKGEKIDPVAELKEQNGSGK